MQGDPVTIDEVGEILIEAILPFYKGFPEGSVPNFRKTLTGEESTNLLNTLHLLVTVIKTQGKAEAA